MNFRIQNTICAKSKYRGNTSLFQRLLLGMVFTVEQSLWFFCSNKLFHHSDVKTFDFPVLVQKTLLPIVEHTPQIVIFPIHNSIYITMEYFFFADLWLQIIIPQPIKIDFDLQRNYQLGQKKSKFRIVCRSQKYVTLPKQRRNIDDLKKFKLPLNFQQRESSFNEGNVQFSSHLVTPMGVWILRQKACWKLQAWKSRGKPGNPPLKNGNERSY